jgi:hypothetical protein
MTTRSESSDLCERAPSATPPFTHFGSLICLPVAAEKKWVTGQRWGRRNRKKGERITKYDQGKGKREDEVMKRKEQKGAKQTFSIQFLHHSDLRIVRRNVRAADGGDLGEDRRYVDLRNLCPIICEDDHIQGRGLLQFGRLYHGLDL